jgi:hypothetical protein
MATLKDIQKSQQGHDSGEETSTLIAPSQSISVEQPLAEKEFIVFKLVKRKRGRTHIDGICDNALNEKTKRRERIWLLNGADSIWQSELTELLKDKEYVKRNRRSLTFEDGVCRLRVNDDRALEFARACTKNVGKNRNGSGKYDFYEYDAGEEQKARYEKQLKKIDMVVKAKEMEVGKMKKLASFFGISFVDELGMPKGDDGVRVELMLKADSDPITFEKYLDSDEVNISYMVKRAIIDAKIDLTGQSGNAIWAGGKGFIAKIPSGRKPYEYLTELAMTNSEEGKAFREQLQTIVT